MPNYTKFNKQESGKLPTCPRCKVKMRLVKGKYGDFFSCTNYPKCKFTSKTRVIGHQFASDFRDGPVNPGNYNTAKK